MIKKRRPGLQDIADLLGISKMTVSRFLRDPALVSEQLQKKIANALDELGYIPNKAPDMLSNAKSYAIGVLLPSLTNQVFADILNGIEQITDQHGYQTMLAHTSYKPEQEEMRLRSLLAYNIDGLILTERTHTDVTRKMIETAGVPVVEIMDSLSPCLDMAVGIDNFMASKAMVQQMIARGHQQTVYLSARQDERSLIRQQGYEATMQEAGLIPQVISTKEPSSYTLGGRLLHEALAKYPNLNGVFCTNDDLALGVLFECQRLGLSVPQQIAIAGFHGHDVGQAVTPQLASVLTPRKEIGRIAAEMLLKRLQGETIAQPIIELPITLLEGGSI